MSAVGLWAIESVLSLLTLANMSLSVLVKSASNLPNVEKFSKSDPMTVCTLQGEFYSPHLLAKLKCTGPCSSIEAV